MTSMPASRSARAMIFAPRSWPSRPGFATTTRIFRRGGGRPAGYFGAVDMRRRILSLNRRHRPARVRRCAASPGEAALNSLACLLAVALAVAFVGGDAAEQPAPGRDDHAGRRAAAPPRPREVRRDGRADGFPRRRPRAPHRRLVRPRPLPAATAASRASTRPTRATTRSAGFQQLDTAIREVRRAGMSVMLDVAFFAPRWAVRRGEGERRDVWRPNVREYGRSRGGRAPLQRRLPDPENRQRSSGRAACGRPGTSRTTPSS